MTEVDRFTIDRDGRKYDVSVMVDDAPMNPRENYDHSATQFYVTQYTYSRWDTYVDELDGDAGDALKHFFDRYGFDVWGKRGDKLKRAFHLWTVITGSPVVLVAGEIRGYVQGQWAYWYALVDTDVMKREGYGGTPQKVAEAEAEDYAAFAYGDVYGVMVESEDGDQQSLWGIVDRDHYDGGIKPNGERSYVREVAEELVDELESVWQEREDARRVAANRVGAGFVGVI